MCPYNSKSMTMEVSACVLPASTDFLKCFQIPTCLLRLHFPPPLEAWMETFPLFLRVHVSSQCLLQFFFHHEVSAGVRTFSFPNRI